MAAAAERRKRTKYSNLSLTHLFEPTAIATTGLLGPDLPQGAGLLPPAGDRG